MPQRNRSIFTNSRVLSAYKKLEQRKSCRVQRAKSVQSRKYYAVECSCLDFLLGNYSAMEVYEFDSLSCMQDWIRGEEDLDETEVRFAITKAFKLIIDRGLESS